MAEKPGRTRYVAGYTKSDGTQVRGYYRDVPPGGTPPRPQLTSAQEQAQQAIRRGGAVRSKRGGD